MPSLTHTEAISRAERLTVSAYRAELDLTTGPETFASTTRITFACTDSDTETFLDVKPRTLHSATLNGRDLDVATLTDGRLPLSGLQAGNELVVVAEMEYSSQGEGLHRYVDPADDRVYLYAQSFLDAAPRIIACFDQPDLKATFSFRVTAPPEWQVLGTGAAEQVEPGVWELAETKPISTYLVALVAGPYASVHRDHDGVPLGLHCRQSLAEHLRAQQDDIFEVTSQCLDEYHRLFGVRYPFGKYDQVFVPGFNTLAMENPGCVSIRDQYVFSSEPTEGDLEDRAVIIAHEMSHSWFGNLVTMRWWGDLWLNEGFADAMGHRVAAEVTRYRNAMTTWSAGRKGLAYAADQRPSTHPVSATDVPDALAGLLNLDRISYYKGSSVLRQLALRVGEEAFQKGMRSYFERFAYGTADYAEFLTTVGEVAGEDLTEWAELWLRTPGVNTLTTRIAVAEGVITAAEIEQTAPAQYPVVRTHVVELGLYDGSGDGEGGSAPTVRVVVDGAHTWVPELVGRRAPRLLLVNDGDHAYAKTRLDEASLAALPEVLPTLPAANRAMLWSSLLMAVQDGALPGARYLDLAARTLPAEPIPQIVSEVLGKARAEVADRFLPPTERDAALSALAQACRQLLADGVSFQLTVFRSLIEFTADTGELRGWLSGDDVPKGITVDAELLWRIRYRLAVLGAFDEKELAEAFAANRGAEGEQYEAKIRAALPTAEAKKAVWEAITTDAALSNYAVWALAEGFWQPEQAELTEPYVQRFFDEAPAAARLRGDQVVEKLFGFLYPRYAVRKQTLELSERLLGQPDLALPLRRKVIDFTDDLRRAVDARAGRVRDGA